MSSSSSMSRGATDYTGELTPLARKRLTKERDLLARESLQDQGIYHSWDPVDNHKAVALIVGPRETPYAGGFYFFEFLFPNSYPLNPPRVAFCTGDGRVRFNPNLYTNGKVCLSILGTWDGPSWTSSCTFRTTLLSIQSLLCKKPLQNEPGHELSNGKDCELYSTMLRYENVAVAVPQLGSLDPKFEDIRGLAESILLERWAEYMEVLESFDRREGTMDRCPLYGFVTKYAPAQVRRTLQDLRAKIEAREQPVAEAKAQAAEVAESVEAEEPPAKRRCTGA